MASCSSPNDAIRLETDFIRHIIFFGALTILLRTDGGVDNFWVGMVIKEGLRKVCTSLRRLTVESAVLSVSFQPGLQIKIDIR